MGILSWIIVGLIAGWFARLVTNGGGYGLAGNVLVGVIGGIFGGFLATNLLGGSVSEISIVTIILALAGAATMLYASRVVTRLATIKFTDKWE